MGEYTPTPIYEAELHDVSYFNRLTAPFDSYSRLGPAVGWSILRSGFVEEGLEVIFGFKDWDSGRTTWTTPKGKHELTPEELSDKEGEIGDGQYYLSEMARYGRANHAEVLQGYPDFERLQAANPGIRLPIYSRDTQELTLAEDDRAVLGMTIMRAIDVVNPKTDELWLGHTGRPSLGQALGDVAGAYAYYANRYDIDLVSALRHTVRKLEVRERSADVVTQADQNDRQPISSRRSRLTVIPWISDLVNAAWSKQWTWEGAQHPARVINRAVASE